MVTNTYFESRRKRKQILREVRRTARDFGGPFLDLPDYTTIREGCYLTGRFERAAQSAETFNEGPKHPRINPIDVGGLWDVAFHFGERVERDWMHGGMKLGPELNYCTGQPLDPLPQTI